MAIRFAEYQVRLLLGAPAVKTPYRLHWKCGCTAMRLARRKYDIEACAAHGPLLREVREDEEPVYDSFIAPLRQSLPGRLA